MVFRFLPLFGEFRGWGLGRGLGLGTFTLNHVVGEVSFFLKIDLPIDNFVKIYYTVLKVNQVQFACIKF